MSEIWKDKKYILLQCSSVHWSTGGSMSLFISDKQHWPQTTSHETGAAESPQKQQGREASQETWTRGNQTQYTRLLFIRATQNMRVMKPDLLLSQMKAAWKNDHWYKMYILWSYNAMWNMCDAVAVSGWYILHDMSDSKIWKILVHLFRHRWGDTVHTLLV